MLWVSSMSLRLLPLPVCLYVWTLQNKLRIQKKITSSLSKDIRLMLFSDIFPTEIQKMDYDFLILMELIVVPLCHLRLYTQLTFILRESMPAAQILKKMSMRIMSLRRSIGYIIQDNWLYGVEHNHDSQLNMVYPYFPRLPHVQITKIVRCPFSTHFVSCHWM
ncbi:uncharacterized protein LOC113325451 [Papaver somniferum]|uniref:uncharacterized protein LOC113325451 n=1 Tax=Papaver somniferum TaxID=3469 RepID=UPI000E6FEEF7|nr:uncharacterized protein LOC113325451 [Papaver somniferum]